MTIVNIVRKIKWMITDYIIEPIRMRVTLLHEIKYRRKTDYERNILLLSHGLEKGMGLENPRKGFGLQKANDLLSNLESYSLSEEDANQSWLFNEGMSVLNYYLEYQKRNGVDVGETLIKRFLELEKIHPYISLSAGYQEYKPEEIYQSLDRKMIEEFMSSRHSVRSYVDLPIDFQTFESVLRMSSSYPSACNRQPIKVYWTNQKDMVSQIDRYIPGNKGFENNVPNWAFIVVDRMMFGIGEDLQWYVNGGIYASYFALSLHAHGISSCIFQIPITWKYLRQIRTIAGIEKRYAVICAVGFGYPKESVKRLMAARKDPSSYNVRF